MLQVLLVSPKRLIQVASNLIHVKDDFLSLPPRSVSLRLSKKLRRYSCLKLTNINWKVADKRIKHFAAFAITYWSPPAFWTCKAPCSPFFQLVRGSRSIREAVGFKGTQLDKLEFWKLSLFSLKSECYIFSVATSRGSLGPFRSTKKVITFCNLVGLRRLPKWVETEVDSSITPASCTFCPYLPNGCPKLLPTWAIWKLTSGALYQGLFHSNWVINLWGMAVWSWQL